jgi:hypothetical protein
MSNAYRFLARKPEGKRPLGRPRCRWEDNIKMYRKETKYERVAMVKCVLSYTTRTPHIA